MSISQPPLHEFCEPANEFLYRISSILGTCIPTNLALISTALGTLSIIAWLFAQLPQIYKNYQMHSTSGLSIYFLAEWLLGDISNLFGSLLTGQATWQVIIACYYCSVDCMLVGQYLWYEHLHHGRRVRSVWWPKSKNNGNNGRGGMESIDGISIYSQSTLDGDSASIATTKPIDMNQKSLNVPEIRGQFRMPRFSSSPASPASSSLSSTPNRITRMTAGTSPAPSPRTILYISLLLAVVCQASPLQPMPTILMEDPSTTEMIWQLFGRLLSWLSTVMYLGSRLPQLYKNHVRRSTSGLSPTLFIAAFFGNLFYSSSLLTNPCAWYDLDSYGGGGWAGPDGSNRVEWIGRAIPFFLGAAGVLFMDAMVGAQFLYFGDGGAGSVVGPVVVIEGDRVEGKKGKWRRVSGWMRGWMPSGTFVATRPGTPNARADNVGEAERLLDRARDERDYGAA
ncbi:Protein RTC2 [Venturia nashicola]|nr:Protein RTC2 [Venturia nashicola]